MKTSFFPSIKLTLAIFLILASTMFLASCRENPVNNQPTLTVEEELLSQGYIESLLWTLSSPNKTLLELEALQVKISGPNSQWQTTTPKFSFSYSKDEGVTWQDTILVFKAHPLYVGSYAFYYQDNEVIDGEDVGSIIVYKKP